MRDKFSETSIIAILTAVSYLVSYIYYSSYYNYFGLPSDLVEINLFNILTSVVAVITIIFIFYSIFYTGFSTISKDTNVHIAWLIKKYTLLIMCLVALLIQRYDIYNKPIPLIAYAIVVSVMIAVDFLYPFLSQKEVGGFKNKIISSKNKMYKSKYILFLLQGKEQNSEKVDDSESILESNSIIRYSNIIFNFIAIVFFLLLVSSTIGSFNASTKKEFILLNEDRVILGIYDKQLITSKVNLKEKTIEPQFTIISNDSKFKYTKKFIGPLKINKQFKP